MVIRWWDVGSMGVLEWMSGGRGWVRLDFSHQTQMSKLLLRGVVGCGGEETGKEQCLGFVSYLAIL